MIKSKYITIIAAILVIAAIVFTILFSSGYITVFKPASANPKYADKLFDTSYVHKINIDVDKEAWQEMLDNARNKEYIECNITIDGTKISNVGIRPKGNTSLSNVESMDSDRYSFKVEFDKYDSGISYMGLDKLSLNNVIQDNTYMKDYFSYRIMQEAGADAPLCSFAYITVNNQDWGLYLAVEGIEDAFAKRNYGNNYGQLYKPDSMSINRNDEANNEDFRGNPMSPPDMEFSENRLPDNNKFPQNPINESQGTHDAVPEENQPHQIGGMGGRGSNAVALVYQDDNIDSYSAIFDNAVFEPTKADKERLIESIRQLNEEDNIENAVDTEEVIRYFAAHNFVVNFDSYTGSMMHNYYLYEKDGKMSMIPWDYNLAFGGFGGGMGRRGGVSDSATQYVNYPIDTPTSGANLEDRPMLGRLLENEEYKKQYHAVFEELINGYFESGDFEKEFNYVYGIIAEYVQKDPSKFCTFDEFTKGAETLKQFCILRAKSVRGQLEGTIPSTSDEQSSNSDSLIDASSISISDMGSMGGGANHMQNMKDIIFTDGNVSAFGENNTESEIHMPPINRDNQENMSHPEFQGNIKQAEPGESTNNEQSTFESHTDNQQPKFRKKFVQGEMPQTSANNADNTKSIILLVVSGIVLIMGLAFAFGYKKKG